MTETMSSFVLRSPKQSDWECEMFGLGRNMVLRPTEGNVPNWFWRLMQFLILGNRWKRTKPTT